jgi:hypothetical protein
MLVRSAAVTASRVWHVGIVVNDIEAAIEHFSKLLDLHFDEPLTVHADIEEIGHRSNVEMTYTYSREGPPHLELIKATPEGLWGADRGEGLHHIGVWQEGLEARTTALLNQGHQAGARIFSPQGELIVVYLDTNHPHVHGTRIELMVPKT